MGPAGDKETFWLGFELVGDTDYVFHQGDAGIIGEVEKTGDPEAEEKRAQDAVVKSILGELDGDGDGADANATDGTEDPESDLTPRQIPQVKVCSPQLLHLDLDGKPLWFNGGLVRNKFLDRREWKFGSWDTYLVEPREIREPGAWFLGEANMCCLTTDENMKSELSPREKELLDAMVKQARKVGIAN